MDAIHTATTDALAALLARQPHSQAKLEFAWQAVVGPAAHRATVSVRLDDTVLHVDVRDATWAHELGQAVATLIPRLNRLLGARAVTRTVIRSPEPRRRR